MKISVIIPHFRGDAYIRDCLESLKAQEYHSFDETLPELPPTYTGERTLIDEIPQVEVIIVKDGCGDEVDAVCAEYPELDIKIFSTGAKKDKPKGVAAARNIGLKNVTGDYVLFIDSDDYISVQSFEGMLTKAKENPGMMVRLVQKKTWFKRESQLTKEEEKRLQKEQEMAEIEAALKEGSDDDNAAAGDDFGEEATDALSAVDGDEYYDELDDEATLIHYWYGSATVLGILIPAGYLKGEFFDETYTYYSDLPFMTRICLKTAIVNRRKNMVTGERISYYKRSHNDSVRMPSLLQEETAGKKDEFIKSLDESWKLAEKEGSMNEEGKNVNLAYLENYILAYILRKMTKGKHPVALKWTDEELGKFVPFMQKIPKYKFKRKRYKFFKKRIIKKLAKGKVKGAKKTANLYSMFRKKKGLFGTPLQWKWNVYKRIFRKFSVKKNVILFESFLGRSYGDSCRYIYEYMQQLNVEGRLDKGDIISENPKFVWCIDNKGAKIPGKHKEVKLFSLRYFYYVARCSVWINNMRQPAWYEKRPGVIFLECWHGTPLKRLVFDMEDVHSFSPKYKMTVYKQSRAWDYLLSDNRFSTECFKTAFLYPEEKILELGYPRNDLLYGDDRDERARKIKEKLGIPADKKVVLYAPTWRDDDYYGPAQYRFDLPLDLEMMKKLKDRYFFVLRTHYFIADHLNIPDEDKDFVMDQSRYNDIGELYLISDVLITDYSSVFFDFANLRRPILFYVYDFEKYAGVLRGFYFDMTTGCPGPLLKTNEEVLDALENIDTVEEAYKDKYKEFTDKFCYLDDGHASERIVKKIFGV